MIQHRTSMGAALLPYRMSDSQPQIGSIGKYEIIREIGRGGMGTVYAVRHPVLEELYAIKVLHHVVRDQPNGIERFRREARVMSKLKHPRILQVDDFGEESDGTLWLRMPLIEGEGSVLADRLVENRSRLMMPLE